MLYYFEYGRQRPIAFSFSFSLKLCSHGTGPKWIRPYPGTDHFCSHGTVLLINVYTGPVCYCSVLNRSKKSSCFYQLSIGRIHVVAFKMAPKYQKEPVQVFTRWRIRQKEPVRVFTRWRIRLGPERFQKLDLLFWRSSFRTWSGTDWRYG